jgi:hypothetical protein
MSEFNPQSHDSNFARLFERLDTQDKVLAEIKEQTIKTNGRVTALEGYKGQVAMVIFVAFAALSLYATWRLK